MSRLIIVITGANSGVGFATCQRLLLQLSQTTPTDAKAQFDVPQDVKEHMEPFPLNQTLTLVMACRNQKKAEAAREKLYHFLDTHLAHRKKQPNYDPHGDEFRRTLKIEIESLDLAQFDSAIKCSQSLHAKYPYISHLICNAGGASFYGINWAIAIPHVLASPIVSVTLPQYNLQRSGERSTDGLGWVWQSNVFTHYVLYRELQDMLSAYSSPSNGHRAARVLWMSSLEAVPFYQSEDWQLLKTAHPYEASKYQMDLIGTQLQRRAVREQAAIDSPQKVHHFVVQPGVVSTGIADGLIFPFVQYFMIMAFYIARFLGSPHHLIKPLKSAPGLVHVALTPLQHLPNPQRFPKSLKYTDVDSPSLMKRVYAVSNKEWTPFSKEVDPNAPIRLGPECDRWGTEKVGVTRVKQWEEHEEESKLLIARCENLYQSLLVEREQPPDIETFRGMN